MGYAYDVICKGCGTKYAVNEGSGMIAMPFHCDRCGTEWWWWDFGPGGPAGEEPNLRRAVAKEASRRTLRPVVLIAAGAISIGTRTARR